MELRAIHARQALQLSELLSDPDEVRAERALNVQQTRQLADLLSDPRP
jgi:hypothetical protein